MATIPKKTVTRRIPKANVEPAPAAKVNTIVNKSFNPISPVDVFNLEIGSYDTSSESLEGIIPAITTNNDDFGFPTDDDSYTVRISHGKGNKNRTFSMDVCGFPHCCGVSVIGGFSFIDSRWSSQEIRTILDGFVSSKVTKGITLQITTAQGRTCKAIAAALATSPCWTAVKTFKNQNSDNKVTIWISNNE